MARVQRGQDFQVLRRSVEIIGRLLLAPAAVGGGVDAATALAHSAPGAVGAAATVDEETGTPIAATLA
jgi:hypothetical protein